MMTKEERNEYNRNWRRANKDKVREYNHRWYQTHKEEQAERMDKWIANNYDRWLENCRKATNKWHQNDEGRASNLLASYVQYDRRYNLGETNLTRDHILTKCFGENSRCLYCGCDDHNQLGLERVSNRLPHSLGNVITSCRTCNVKRGHRTFGDYLDVLGITFDEWLAKNGGEYEAEEIKISLN